MGRSETADDTQRVGVPVGALLSAMETAPVEISRDGLELWHIAGGTTQTYNELVGVVAGTGFRMGGEVPLSVLLDLVDSLAAYPEEEWLGLPTSGEGTSESMIETRDPEVVGAVPCELQRLEIREP